MDLTEREKVLVDAGRKVLAGLLARIDAASEAGGESVPVFNGIADLHDALGAYEDRAALATLTGETK